LATPRTLREWAQLSQEALARFIQTEGAAVWPEAEAKLSETSWVHDHLDPSIPPHIGPQPHHLSAAKRSLQHARVIAEQTVVLNGRQVSAWVDASAAQHRRGTEVSHQAARKRRLYRRFLGWTSNSRLCGSIAEQVVDAGLQELKGSRLWIPPGSRPGQITDLLGRPIQVGGPLDAAGAWFVDPYDLRAGYIPFAVEIKNIRSWIYPWDHEAWDLLSKVADFPDVLPVLVARKIHQVTFNCFKDIGALGCEMRHQWFAAHGTTKDSLTPAVFEHTVRTLGFNDATRASDPPSAEPRTRRWFERAPTFVNHTLLASQADRWRQAAPIVRQYQDLRSEPDHQARSAMWAEFAREIREAGLYERAGWAPHDFEEVEEHELDDFNYFTDYDE
jgi:hypothetical protein